MLFVDDVKVNGFCPSLTERCPVLVKRRGRRWGWVSVAKKRGR